MKSLLLRRQIAALHPLLIYFCYDCEGRKNFTMISEILKKVLVESWRTRTKVCNVLKWLGLGFLSPHGRCSADLEER